jgi:hypothetical protein
VSGDGTLVLGCFTVVVGLALIGLLAICAAAFKLALMVLA